MEFMLDYPAILSVMWWLVGLLLPIGLVVWAVRRR